MLCCIQLNFVFLDLYFQFNMYYTFRILNVFDKTVISVNNVAKQLVSKSMVQV